MQELTIRLVNGRKIKARVGDPSYQTAVLHYGPCAVIRDGDEVIFYFIPDGGGETLNIVIPLSFYHFFKVAEEMIEGRKEEPIVPIVPKPKTPEEAKQYIERWKTGDRAGMAKPNGGIYALARR